MLTSDHCACLLRVNIMKEIIVFVAFIAVGAGVKYNGLRAKFGWSDALTDIKYFFNIPRTTHEVEAEEWRRTERPKGSPLAELRMYCPPGRMVCPLYDTTGFVAGLQIAVPLESIDPELKPDKYFTRWNAPAAIGEPSREYWTATQYFAAEDTVKIGAGPTIENGKTLQDGGVWVKGLNGKLMKIPLKEAELENTMFKKQNCIPNMGTHYYYNMSKTMPCDPLILPWFGLVTQGHLIGVGFQTFGKLPQDSPKDRQWFEDIPNGNRKFPLTGSPRAPDCLLDRFEKYGLISVHIYYVNEPWNIRCKSGDSVEPAPMLERFALNGYRYANQIGDEFKKIIHG